jgi:hypothetical protein
MLLSELQRQMGQLSARITVVSRVLALEHIVDAPRRDEVLAAIPGLRLRLRQLHTRYYALEARLPTPETLSAAAYGRAMALGLGIEAAEAERSKAYHHARQNKSLPRFA